MRTSSTTWSPTSLDGDRHLEDSQHGFYDTELEALLEAREIGLLLVTGVGKNVCVESTVRDAWTRGFRCLTVSDATATLSDEEHEASLKNLGWFGGTATAEEIMAAWKGPEKGQSL